MMSDPVTTSSIAALPDIRSLVPHSGVMLLLDRVLAADEDSLCAEVTMRPDSLFMGADGVGSWVGVEYMAQAIAAFAGYAARLKGEEVKMGFLLGTRRYEAKCDRFMSGMVLRVVVRRILLADNGIGSFECQIEDASHIVLAQATITVFQPHDMHVFLEGNAE